MEDNKISERIYDELISYNLKYYIDSLSSNSQDDVSDIYGRMAKILSTMSEEEKETIFYFFKQIIVDTASNLLGVIDGTTFIHGIEGEYILKYNNHEIQGALQDYFLSKFESDNKLY